MRRHTRTEFRHTPDEKATWQAAAEAHGLSLSEYARMTLNGATGGRAEQARAPAVTTERMDPAALRQLRGVANNLNQVVHFGHAAQSHALGRIAAIAEEIRALVLDDLAKAGRRP